jgi:ABC-type bacteriocin/lantibiotic exporter with double-glycine peptidase domain
MDILLQDRIHQLSDWIVTSVFPSSHWWMHFVVHMVLVGMPLAFLGLLVAWLVRIVHRRLSGRRGGKPRDFASPFPVNLFIYILRHTRRTQAILLVAALVSLPLLYAVLELPKQIINRALDTEADVVSVLGTPLSKYELLFLLCVLYLAAVLVIGGVKYFINVLKGRLAEGMMRRMRFTTFRAWSRGKKPCDHSQIIPVLVQEVEPIAGFTGEAFLTPIFEGGTFLTILAFMVFQDPVLGAAALTLVPLQIALIPRLQRRVSALGRERSREMRSFGAAVAGADPRRPYEGSRPVLSIAKSLKKVQAIRLEIYQRKFFIKGLNNFIAHLTPFFFYTIGGYLVIEGQLSLGALVAVLAAHKDMSAPLRELLIYYQTMDDVRVRYEDIRRFLGDQSEIGQPDGYGSSDHGRGKWQGNHVADDAGHAA